MTGIEFKMMDSDIESIIISKNDNLVYGGSIGINEGRTSINTSSCNPINDKSCINTKCGLNMNKCISQSI